MKTVDLIGKVFSFSHYTEGTSVPECGTGNLVVNTEGGLALTSGTTKPITATFKDFPIFDAIEVSIKIDLTAFNNRIVLWNDNLPITHVNFKGFDIVFAHEIHDYRSSGWGGGTEANDLTLVVHEGSAKLYINGNFIGSEDLFEHRVNRITIEDLKPNKDFLYAVSIAPLNLSGKSFNFAKYPQGAKIPELGENHVIHLSQEDLGLTSASSQPATVTLEGFHLADSAEFELRLDLTAFDTTITLWNENQAIVNVMFKGFNIQFGTTTKDFRSANWNAGSTANDLKLVLDREAAELYLNDELFGAQEIDFEVVTKVTIAGLKQDKDFLYSMSIAAV